MAFANILLSKNSNLEDEIEVPVGFSWGILFAPLIICIFAFAVLYALATILAIADLEFEEANLLVKLLFILIFKILFLLQILSFCLVPLFRKDRKWTVLMTLAGILTAGVSIVVFAFIYNKLFILEKYKQGYRITKIMTMRNEAESLSNLNPIEYNQHNQYLGHLFVWVNWYGIKFMRYFSDLDKALNFVKCHPNKCLKINYIVKTMQALPQIDGSLREKYTFPIQVWAQQFEADHTVMSRKSYGNSIQGQAYPKVL
jgi:hypothetical protein